MGSATPVTPVTRPAPWQMEEFQIYEKYCQNKPRSESLWRQCSDCPFFQVRPGQRPGLGEGGSRLRVCRDGPPRAEARGRAAAA